MNNYPALHPGKADFVDIRRSGGLYVDKTPFFRQLLETVPAVVDTGAPPMLGNSHQFLARPRRFGKSLLVNTLETWFQGIPPHRSAMLPPGERDLGSLPRGWSSPPWLWEGLDVEDWHGHHGWHPVIRLDMSRLTQNDPARMRSDLQRYLILLVEMWGRRGIPRDTAIWGHSREDDSPAIMLLRLMSTLGEFYRSQPVVLVDEYDAPVTRHMGTKRDPAAAVENLRDLYRVLKDDDGLLYGVFVTGITRFAREHLFSAANNMTDVSEWGTYAAVCGFTEEEVACNLKPHRQALKVLDPRFQDARVLAEWRDLYNGYRFAPYPDVAKVYNPFTLLHGLDRTLQEPNIRTLAAAGRWPSAWSESGHPGLAARLAADTRQVLPGTVREGNLPPLPPRGLVDLARPDYARLMLDTGYYTWHGGDNGEEMHLNFPNREVAESWMRDILKIWETPRNMANDGLVAGLHACLKRGDVPGFAKRLETFAFGLARENLQSEASFRTLLQSLFLQMAEPTQSEKSSQGGRSDHEITVGGRLYIIEVKYNRPAAAGLAQIRERSYGREYLDAGLVATAVALAFRHDKGKGTWLECVYEDLPTLLRERDTALDPEREYKPPKNGG